MGARILETGFQTPGFRDRDRYLVAPGLVRSSLDERMMGVGAGMVQNIMTEFLDAP